MPDVFWYKYKYVPIGMSRGCEINKSKHIIYATIVHNKYHTLTRQYTSSDTETNFE